MESPYRPGFGARPAVFVGRDGELGRARTLLTRLVNSRHAESSVLMLVGNRGLGKTVMLDVVADEAADRGLLPVQVALDGVSDCPQLIAARLGVAADGIAPSSSRSLARQVQQRLARLSVEVNAGVVKVTSGPAERQRDETGNTSAREHLAGLLVSVAQMSVRAGRRGLVILIDEFQEARHADLVVVANALQDALRTGAPLAVFGAGLPGTPERIADAASFTERFDFRTLQRLTDDQSERALIEPALASGVTWEQPAAHRILTAAHGSPYLIQLFGDEVWLLADPEPEGTLTDVQAAAALADAQDRLFDGMFRSRWSKTTGRERQFLLALAETVDRDGVAEIRDYAAVLGRTASQLSTTRQALLDKGLVERAGRGRLRFALEGFKEFVLQRTGSE